jgi:hypothetical protein
LYALAKNAECPSSSNIAAKSRDFNFLDIFGQYWIFMADDWISTHDSSRQSGKFWFPNHL